MSGTIGKFAAMCGLLASSALGVLAEADVMDAGPGGFSLVHEVTIDAARADVWQAAVDEVGLWWSDDLTISGDAGNLNIAPVLQGCFCEGSDDRVGVVHLTVTSISPNAMLRLTGGLGPLGLMGVAGNMTWEFFDAEDGTSVRFTYAVGGYRPGGLNGLANSVDYVIGDALDRLKAYVETGDAENANVD